MMHKKEVFGDCSVVEGERDECLKSNKYALVAAFALCITAVACSKKIEHGSFQFMNIGDTQDEIIKKARSNGVDFIAPAHTDQMLVDSSNLNGIDFLRNSGDVRITNNTGSVIQLDFGGGFVEKVVPTNIENDLGVQDLFYVGQRKSEFLEKLKSFLRANPEFQAMTYLPDRRWVDIRVMNENDYRYLSRYDLWEFHGKKHYSHYLLSFSNGHLKKIEYEWSLVELP